MKPNIALKSNGTKSASDNVGGRKLLEAPVLLSNAATYMQEVEEETGPSIWNKPKGEELVSLFQVSGPRIIGDIGACVENICPFSHSFVF